VYVTILVQIGFVALAMTINLNINFLNKPSANADIIDRCNVNNMGELLVIGEVSLYSDGSDKLDAHITGTYSISSKS